MLKCYQMWNERASYFIILAMSPVLFNLFVGKMMGHKLSHLYENKLLSMRKYKSLLTVKESPWLPFATKQRENLSVALSSQSKQMIHSRFNTRRNWHMGLSWTVFCILEKVLTTHLPLSTVQIKQKYLK